MFAQPRLGDFAIPFRIVFPLAEETHHSSLVGFHCIVARMVLRFSSHRTASTLRLSLMVANATPRFGKLVRNDSTTPSWRGFLVLLQALPTKSARSIDSVALPP